MQEVAPPITQISFRRLIGTGISAKLLVDIGVQIFNPFLPVIASGLGLTVIQMGQLIGLRSAMGLFAPVSGIIADRTSFRLVIRLALFVNAAGFFMLGLSHAPWTAVLAMMLAGLGASSFIPILQAYVSAGLPYNIRARGLGMLEYAWALTGIVGLSVVGLVIQFTGWRAPFFVLALGMVAMTFVFARMPAAHAAAPPTAAPRARPAHRGSLWVQVTGFFRLHENNRSTYATIVAGSLSYFAAMQLMVAHGAWLQSQYGLGPAQLGLVAFVFGWFDLAASVCVSLFTDRIGKKRSVLLGISGSLIGYATIPFLNLSVILATVSIAVTRMFFEFNIVSHFPLLSEQAPDERGKVMTLGSAVALLGGSLAGFTGPWLLVNRGVSALAWTSAAAVLVALCVVLIAVKDPGSPHRID